MKRITKLSRFLPWIFLCFSLIFSITIYAKYGRNTLDADQSSEFVLADLLNREKLLISQNWYYSTELRTVSPVPVYQLGLILFHSWHAARIFSIIVLMNACIAAFLFAARCAGFKEEAVYCAACFILPFSKTHSFLFSWGCFYSTYFILGCILFGLFLSLSHHKCRSLILFLLCILGIWAGTAGIRMFMIVGVPLLVTGFLGWVYPSAQFCPDTTRSVKWLFTAAVTCFLSITAGYMINSHLLTSFLHFQEYSELTTDSFSVSEILARFDALLYYFSYESYVPFLSFPGVISLLNVFLVFAIIVSPFILLKKKLSFKEYTIPVFALSAIAIVWIIDIMASGYEAASTSVGYYIMGLIFGIFCIFILISRSSLPAFLRHALMISLCLLFYGSTLTFVKMHVPSHKKQQAQASEWLTENGYTHGFATFWNGNLLTELSDGKLDVIIYDTWRSREPYEWLQSVSHTQIMPDGPVFLYTDTEEIELDPSPCLDDSRLIYAEGAVRIYIFPDAQSIYTTQLNQYITK